LSVRAVVLSRRQDEFVYMVYFALIAMGICKLKLERCNISNHRQKPNPLFVIRIYRNIR
jgi:hypothetical protein